MKTEDLQLTIPLQIMLIMFKVILVVHVLNYNLTISFTQKITSVTFTGSKLLFFFWAVVTYFRKLSTTWNRISIHQETLGVFKLRVYSVGALASTFISVLQKQQWLVFFKLLEFQVPATYFRQIYHRNWSSISVRKFSQFCYHTVHLFCKFHCASLSLKEQTTVWTKWCTQQGQFQLVHFGGKYRNQ